MERTAPSRQTRQFSAGGALGLRSERPEVASHDLADALDEAFGSIFHATRACGTDLSATAREALALGLKDRDPFIDAIAAGGAHHEGGAISTARADEEILKPLSQHSGLSREERVAIMAVRQSLGMHGPTIRAAATLDRLGGNCTAGLAAEPREAARRLRSEIARALGRGVLVIGTAALAHERRNPHRDGQKNDVATQAR